MVHRSPLLLMCPPRHYSVCYHINPWMRVERWQRESERLTADAHREWDSLATTYRRLGAHVAEMPPQEGLPDMVFTANSAAVFNGTVLLSRFRHAERRGEQVPGERTFERLRELGLVDRLVAPADGEYFEGAGDCIWDAVRTVFWAGWGQRSGAGAPALVQRAFGRAAVALELVDPRFYHLDTCFAVLPRGEILYYPPAFTAAALAAIHARVAPEQRIEASSEDALALAVNAFSFGQDVVMGACSPKLRALLAGLGYRVHVIPLSSFNLSGGAAYCLTLRLDLDEGTLAAPMDLDPSLAA